MDDNITPAEDFLEGITSESNRLTPEERHVARTLTENSTSAVQASLINLMMGQFNKVATYDEAASSVLKKLLDRADVMESEELVKLLGVLSNTATKEAKNVLDMFKKNGNDVGKLIEDLRESLSSEGNTQNRPVNKKGNNPVVIDVTPEKADKVLRMIKKIREKSSDGQ